jgi:hypothetical protein
MTIVEKRVLPVFFAFDYNLFLTGEVQKEPKTVGTAITGGLMEERLEVPSGTSFKFTVSSISEPKERLERDIAEKLLLENVSDFKRFEPFIEEILKKEISEGCAGTKHLKSFDVFCPKVLTEEELKEKIEKIVSEIKSFSERMREEIRRTKEEERKKEEEERKKEEETKKAITEVGCRCFLHNSMECFGKDRGVVHFPFVSEVGIPDFKELMVEKELRAFKVAFEKPVEAREEDGRLLLGTPKYFIGIKDWRLQFPPMPYKKIEEEDRIRLVKELSEVL